MMFRRTALILLIVLSLSGGGIAAWHLVRTPAILTIGNLTPESAMFSLTPAPCDIVAALRKPDPAFAAIIPTISEKTYRYAEVRNGTTKTYHEPEVEIVLRVLDTDTCRTQMVMITQRGDQLIAPDGWGIEIVKQPNGIRWNYWSTDYEIVQPSNQIVIENKYPHEEGTGKKRTITQVIYTAATKHLRIPALVREGPAYTLMVARDVAEELRQGGVSSYATPGKLLTDEPAANPNWIARLIPNEHMDFGAFLLDRQWSTEHAFVRIGANRDRFGAYTCSSAAACGAAQIIQSTYQETRRAFPDAGVITNADAGRRDFRNSIKVAFLLHNRNLAALVIAFGPEILKDPLLEEYLTAAYNTGVNRVIAVLRIARKQHPTEWTDARGKCSRLNRYAECLLTETKGYIAKLRYLQEVWPSYLAFQTP